MSEWKPISTAPEDGTFVLLYAPIGICHGAFMEAVSDETSEEFPRGKPLGKRWFMGLTYHDAKAYNPTHWMPLPPPPQE